MRTLTARQFRTAFSTLTEQVQVSLNRDGELVTLGIWTPAGAVPDASFAVSAPAAQPTEPTPSVSVPDPRRAEAERDKILRGINKSKDERR